ncbi:MAG TPA: DoxX family protein [Xanthomonadaceae bacterium]|nr:DoxX family protein [Xanthomonadaceae bacterium]
MNQDKAEDIGKLILRLTLGILILLHGIAKLRGGIDGIQGMLEGAGLPGFFAYAVYLGEVLGPLLLIVGFYARIGAALIALNMIVAIALAHAGEVMLLGPNGGWAIELQAMFLFTAIALVLTGPGRIGLNTK